MSNHVTSLLRRKHLGVGFTSKSIILLMGDLASDDGSGIWASKATMAKELETTGRTIQRNIHALIEAGFVAAVGKHKHRNGETVEYRIIVEAVENCRDCKDTPPSQRHPSTQHVGSASQDVAPDTVSPLTDGRPTPDTVSGEPPTECHPNQSKPNITNCAADAPHDDFDFGSFFDELFAAYPRKGSWEQTEAAVQKLIDDGAKPSDLSSAVKAYASEQAGNEPRYLKLSENFFAEGVWKRHVSKPAAKVDEVALIEGWAKDIIARKPWARTIRQSQARQCIAARLVTPEQCKEAGIIV